MLHLQELERVPAGAHAGRKGRETADAVQPGRSSREMNGTGRTTAGDELIREKKTANAANTANDSHTPAPADAAAAAAAATPPDEPVDAGGDA
jgi:hypothetical protein